MPLIEIKGLTKRYGSDKNLVYALKEVRLQIEKGDFVAIIGQSGSGKSTLMNIIGCLDTPTSGSYRINGEEVAKMDSDELANLRAHTFGFVFQKYNLLSSITAQDNVALPAVYIGTDFHSRRKRAEEILTDLELGDRLTNNPNELSGGQQQRVSIGRALMNGGEVILADEPTGALDSNSGKMVMQIINELHQKGHTIILVTHDPIIANYASRVVEIKDGSIIRDERIKDLLPKQETKQIFTSKKKNSFSLFADMLKESFKMSVQAIMAHKMRSLLTMLGIIIGIASVVSVVALGRGSQQMIMQNVSSMGTNTIDIYPGKTHGDRYSGKYKTLNVQDSEVLGAQEYILNSTPLVTSSGNILYDNISVTGNISGVGPQYFDAKGYELAIGRELNKKDIDHISSVAVIDDNTRKTLFEGIDPLGRTILFNKKPLTVIGVAKKLNLAGPASESLVLWTPYTTAMYKITGNKWINTITVRVADDANSQVAENSITQILTQRHGDKDFFTVNSDSIKQTIESTTNTMTILISSIAFISLLVGGIGVMNIMLVSVTERTKEIGLRMAIGAKQSNIMQQFLIEAILICFIGGFIGILLSGVIAFTFNMFWGDTMPMLFSVESLILAILFSTAIGTIFGFMPAKSAARLNPIEALARD